MLDLHHLPGSDLQETQVYTYRAHPITLLPLIFTIIFLIAIPPGIYASFTAFQPELLSDPGHMTLFILGTSIFFLFGSLFIYQMFIDYWLDVCIVTDKRILDIEQQGLFSRTVSELRLFRVQDVTAEIKGFWKTMFNYGDVFIQTAAEKERFEFIGIPHPNEVAKMILDLAEEDRKDQLGEAVEEFGLPAAHTP